MLEAAIILELILGKHLEALIIGVLLAFNAVLGYVQEGRAQATLAALKTRLALNVSVLRDSHWAMVLAASLVPGDVVKLSLGSIVAADVRINTGEVLLDQSMLTGESIPVEAGPGFQTFAGALVRRGEAVAEVTATGSGTKFGRTAELVLSAHAESSQQKAVLHLVRNLSIFNGALILVMVAYARHLNMHTGEIIPLVLTAVLASIPVALPATFTLAAAIGARDLGRLGVLPTRLSAVDEAASIDVLCADKTGTLTLNELGVSDTRAMAGFDVAHVLGLAALASSDGGNDSVDAAIRAEAAKAPAPGMPVRSAFVPFDPATKLAEATTRDSSGGTVRVIKGAFEVVAALAGALPDSPGIAAELEAKGMRVLAVAVGPAGALKLAGIIGLSDSPRADSAALVAELGALGVRTVMITGDAPATAAIVAKAVGLSGAVSPPGPIPKGVRPEDFAVYAGVLPEGKFNLVKAFQGNGHVVGMCGDGANDAPALRQAQMGIAVSTATDVAKSAAGIVLTKPGLGGIVASVKEGRVTFQRILTYALNSVTKKVVQVLFLAVGLFMTGHSILTPMLMVIIMLSGDLLGMSLATDNVKASGRPNSWRIGNLTAAGVFMGVSELAYCVAAFSIAKFLLGYGIDALRTVAFVAIVFGNQATTYANRERGRMGASLPSPWLVGSSAVDVAIASTLAACGVAMTGMPVMMIAGLLAAAALFAFALDFAKVPVLRRLSLD
jgi:H+-transporting ATPase